MEQTIYFDEGKLVVETNNGRIKDGKTTAQISGEFIANADTVAMLLSELEGHSLTMKYTSYFGWMERSGSWSLITEKEIAEEIKATKEALEELKGKLNIATRKANMLKDVLNRIENHNKKWWRFWERKIDISDIIKLYGTNLLKD
jgi:hypothetical protein